jgi:hypothetical protein
MPGGNRLAKAFMRENDWHSYAVHGEGLGMYSAVNLHHIHRRCSLKPVTPVTRLYGR